MTANILVREAPLPDGGVWWTDVDRLQQRAYDSVTVEPNLQDAKQYSYTINKLRTDSKESARDTSGDPVYDNTPDHSICDVTETISTYGCLFESDTDNITKPETTPSMLYRGRSQWQRNFDLKNEWRDSWTDYRLHSSIHGVRHAAEPQPFCTRRVLWTMLLLAMCGIFLYLMVQTISIYLTWPVLLHVRTIYKTSVHFPAVTLCNQNTFRVTAATDNGWYDLLSDMFSRDLKVPPLDVSLYNDTNTTMFDVYNRTAPRKQDMIVKCMWDGRPCSDSDFERVYTDYGVCYTFNSGTDDTVRYTSHTGSGSGLTLLLNLEQYEYMSGPNSGAGLKVRVHSQQETPFVQHHGVTLPRGSHSFIALKYTTNEYLPRPYGSCESKDLVYYKDYSDASCMADCRQMYLMVRCGCRNFYMPDRPDNGSAPYCTIYQHQTCVIPAETEFDRQRVNLCQCPIPCSQQTWGVQTSLGGVSNFEILNMLYSGDKVNLQWKQINAMKMTSRALKDVSDADTRLIQQFVSAVYHVDEAIHALLNNMDQSTTTADDMLQSLTIRAQFHQTGGFDRLSSYLYHAFMLGWERYKERALDELQANMYSTADTYEMIMLKLDDNLESTTVETLWLIIDNIVRGRIDLTKIAEDYVTKTYDAFLTGTPILTEYKETINGHFDDAFIDVSILAGEIKDNPGGAEWVRDKLIEDIKSLRGELLYMEKLGNNYITGKNKDVDKKDVKNAADEFIQQTRVYISRMDGFEEKIIANLQEALDAKLDIFHRANRSLHQERTDLTIILSTINSLVQTFNATVWRDIMDKAKVSQDYLDDPYADKSELATELTSRALLDKLGDFDIFFNAIRGRGQDLTERWIELRLSYKNLWLTMLGESSLQPLYKQITSAYKKYSGGVKADDSGIVKEYSTILADLLPDILPYQLKQIELDELKVILNADFYKRDVDALMADIDASFGELISNTDVMGILTNLDMEFQSAFDQYEHSMVQFIQANKVEEQFYVDNMMRVDVFMRDLNSENIVHQPAYDYINLLGDVGGLLSLFLGASILAVIELLDLVIHQLFKWIMAHKLVNHVM